MNPTELEIILIKIEIMVFNMSGHAYSGFGHLIIGDMDAHEKSKNEMQAEHDKLRKYIEEVTK